VKNRALLTWPRASISVTTGRTIPHRERGKDADIGVDDISPTRVGMRGESTLGDGSPGPASASPAPEGRESHEAVRVATRYNESPRPPRGALRG
jgi:hypothetical protein